MSLLPTENIAEKIYLIRNQKVMLDADLALLFGVENKRLKEQVRRNITRFPEMFMFQLNNEEYDFIRSQIATLKQGQHSKYLPFAFTEHGILMLSSVLNSPTAVQMSIQIIETFVQLRKLISNYAELEQKIEQLESKFDGRFIELYDTIRKLMADGKTSERKSIGYKKQNH